MKIQQFLISIIAFMAFLDIGISQNCPLNSYADVVIAYDNKGCNIPASHTDPMSALGAHGNGNGAVSLGKNGGYITLGFTDNILTNDGTSGKDLWVFEVGPRIEGTKIYLRPANSSTQTALNGLGLSPGADGLYFIGAIGGSTSGLDIDIIGTFLAGELQFDQVKLESRQTGGCSSFTTHGPDISAICALSSINNCSAHPNYEALVAFYNATGGASWTSAWDLNDCDICNWYGVGCNSDDRVNSLDLSNNNLIGGIPAEIADLTNLSNLSLSLNQLSGGIPTEIGSLPALNALALDNNQLDGDIPGEIWDLINLSDLSLNANQLTGNIAPEIGNLSNLIVLNLSTNQLNGEIPMELGNLISLTNLNASNNQLSGCFAVELSSLCGVNSVNFFNNPDLPGGGDFPAFCFDGTGSCDPCLFTGASGQVDSDCDGIVDECDLCPGGDDSEGYSQGGTPYCADPYPNLENLPAEWKCGNHNHKVLICHNGNTLCISPNALPAHLGHGDYIGPCDNASCSQNLIAPSGPVTLSEMEGFHLYPNPASKEINLKWKSDVSGMVEIQLIDLNGRAVFSKEIPALKGKNLFNHPVDGLGNGLYFIKITSHFNTRLFRFTKSN